MDSYYAIGPSIGVARLGNSPDEFYLEPESTGGLPIECDRQGNPTVRDGAPVFVSKFKDEQGRVKRQAARFRIYRVDSANPLGGEITLADPAVEAIEWTVHVANKKACWYNFEELVGNLLYGENNSYQNQNVPLRNPNEPAERRQKLIIDPGPRTLTGPGQAAEFDAQTSYPFVSFPPAVTQGEQIKTLGGMRSDAQGRLIVLGGFGLSGGDESITSFAGADTWHDDISDGQINCTLKLKSQETIKLQAWVIVGSPKFAPEVVNITTLDDTMYDSAVRNLNAAPHMFSNGQFNPGYVADFETEIRPILDRPAAYRWVANTPSMNSLSPPPFDPRDASPATSALREAYVALFRRPGPQDAIAPSHNILFSDTKFPMMPLNSGSNSVSNGGSNPKAPLIDKFMTLTETQQFFLDQWAKGKFRTGAPRPQPEPLRLSRASVSNCVGNPFCPGIEVTWSTRNPNLYSGLLTIRQRYDEAVYEAQGLTWDYDETAAPSGLEPGDLTKRMAIPWQADFFQCSIQFVNFTDPKVNKDDGIPKPPTYYAYWWPPQSPWQVISNDLTPDAQAASGVPAGYQVLYSRGINTFSQMISYWYYMGFIVNQTTGPHRDLFPYIVEQERNHAKFTAAAVAVGDASNVVTGADTNFANAWYLTPPPPEPPQVGARLAGRPRVRPPRVAFATSRHQGRSPGPNARD